MDTPNGRLRFRILSLSPILFLVLLVILHVTPANGAPEITVADVYVVSTRANIMAPTQIGFYLVHTSDYSPLMGAKVYVTGSTSQWYTNEQGWVIVTVFSNTVGKITWSITKIVSGGTELEFDQLVSDPEIIFDRVLVELETPNPRIGVGTSARIEYDAKYEYDDAPFQGDIILNVGLKHNNVGKITFTVESISDDQYGVTVFKSNSVDVIFDQVAIFIVARNVRIDTGTNADIFEQSALYLFDQSEFTGSFILNDTLSKNKVGKYAYTVASISDILYNVDSFIANNIEIIFDKVIIDLETDDVRIDVGNRVNITIESRYAYDMEEFWGQVTLNNMNKRSNTVGKYEYTVKEIDDYKFGLTRFSSNTLEVIWDRINIQLETKHERINIGDEAEITWTGYYEYDNWPINDMVDVSLNTEEFLRDSIGSIEYEVITVEDSLYGLSRYSSNILKVIWDFVDVKLEFSENRIGISTEANPRIHATYRFDGTKFEGKITLNNSLVHDQISKHFFTVSSINDDVHEITSFNSNTVYCIWDNIDISFKFPTKRIRVRNEASPQINATYEYDGTPFTGKIQLNDSLSQNEIGEHIFTVTSITDSKFDVATFKSNTASCIWDEIISMEPNIADKLGAATLEMNIFYKTDGSLVDETSLVFNKNEFQSERGDPQTYVVSTWAPIIKFESVTNVPGFPSEHHYYTHICTNNILMYLSSSSILIISSVLIIKKRTQLRQLESHILQQLKSEGVISFSHFSDQYSAPASRIKEIISKKLKNGNTPGIVTYDELGFISEQKIRAEIHEYNQPFEDIIEFYGDIKKPEINILHFKKLRTVEKYRLKDITRFNKISLTHLVGIYPKQWKIPTKYNWITNINRTTTKNDCPECTGIGWIIETPLVGRGLISHTIYKCTICGNFGFKPTSKHLLSHTKFKRKSQRILIKQLQTIREFNEIQLLEKDFETGRRILEYTPTTILDFDPSFDKELIILLAPTLFSEIEGISGKFQHGVYISNRERNEREDDKQHKTQVSRTELMERARAQKAQKVFEDMKKRRKREIQSSRDR